MPGSDLLQSAVSSALFYPISIMLQISTKDSGILYLTKIAKTNNDIADFHLVSRRVISTSSDVHHVYRCPKRTFTLPQTIMLRFDISYYQNYYATSMLLEKLCYMKTIMNFRDPGTDRPQSVGSRSLFYLITIKPKFFYQRF